jgi:hypothetical protein
MTALMSEGAFNSLEMTFYSPLDATKLTDGSIMVPATSFSDKGMLDASLTIKPDQADYKFWVWLLRQWRYRSSLISVDIPTLKGEHQLDGASDSKDTRSFSVATPISDDISNVRSETMGFDPLDGRKFADGTISVPAHGNSDKGIWDGFMTIKPDDVDYEFWVWLLQRWRYRSSLDSVDIPTLKDEYQKYLAQ